MATQLRILKFTTPKQAAQLLLPMLVSQIGFLKDMANRDWRVPKMGIVKIP